MSYPQQSANTITNVVLVTPGGTCSNSLYLWVTYKDPGVVGQYDVNTGALIRYISVGATPNGICVDNTYVWVANFGDNTVTQIDASTGDIVGSPIPTGSQPLGICSNNTYVWVANSASAGANTVTKIEISSSTVINTITVNNRPYTICVDNTYVWVSCSLVQILPTRSYIARIDNSNVVTYYNSGNAAQSLAICSNNTFVYVATNNVFVRVFNISSNVYTTSITVTNNGSLFGICTDNVNVWLARSSNFVYYFPCNTASPPISTVDISSGYSPQGISINGNNVWVSDGSNNSVLQIQLSDPLCFKEDTKILTISGYIPIQDLKPRRLVKTLNHGYVPINMIGTTTINNASNAVKNCLYKCSKEAYPELFEDLYITGGHSILVDEFKDDQQQEVIKMLGAVFVTEGKFRLPACIDNRASLHKDKKPVKIYHIALDNNYSDKNYGIYANGLLVESCDKITLKELSKMTIISG